MKFPAPGRMERSRKHRLRKRLRLGELQEFGFSFGLTYDRSALSYDDALDHLINFVEAQGWVFDSGDSSEQVEISDYLCPARVDSLDEADRESTHL